MEAAFKFSGEVQVFEKFDRLTVAVRDKLLKRSVRDAMDPMVKAAQAFIRNTTGVLSGSIEVTVTSRGGKGSSVRGYMGPARNIKVPVAIHKRGLGLPPFVAIPTRYAHLVEFGHKIVVKGEVVGFVAPHPFMRVAWVNYGGEVALATLATSLEKGILAEPV